MKIALFLQKPRCVRCPLLTTRQEQLESAARPLPEAPPRARETGDLGPAKAESPALGRAGPPRLRPSAERSPSRSPAARLYCTMFGAKSNAFLGGAGIVGPAAPAVSGKTQIPPDSYEITDPE
jgi:hypothetical protein